MSVPVHKRKPSQMEYLNQTSELMTDIILMIGKIPDKHKYYLGTALMMTCSEALMHGKMANAIYVQSRQDLDTRIEELSKMEGAVSTIPSLIHSWVKVVKLSPETSKSFKKSLNNKEMRVAQRCEYIFRLINGLKKSDRDRFKKRTSGKIGVPTSVEEIIKDKTSESYLKGLFYTARSLKSISNSLISMQMYQGPAPKPKDLPEYKFDSRLMQRLNWGKEKEEH